MSALLSRIVELARRGEVFVSRHGFRELASDGIVLDDVIDALAEAVVVEEYPDFAKGPCVLVREPDGDGNPVHVLWGIKKRT